MKANTSPEVRSVPSLPGFNVTEDGRVFCGSRERRLQRNLWGYAYLVVERAGKRKTYMAHRLVAEAFIGPSEGREVDHIDGVRDHNHWTNLRYCTRAENNRFSAEAGRTMRGEAHVRAVLTEAQVLEIRRRYKPAGRQGRRRVPESLGSLAREFGTGVNTIRHIVCGETWKHLKEPAQ